MLIWDLLRRGARLLFLLAPLLLGHFLGFVRLLFSFSLLSLRGLLCLACPLFLILPLLLGSFLRVARLTFLFPLLFFGAPARVFGLMKRVAAVTG